MRIIQEQLLIYTQAMLHSRFGAVVSPFRKRSRWLYRWGRLIDGYFLFRTDQSFSSLTNLV